MGSNPIADTYLISDIVSVSSKEFLDIQATIECRFFLKGVQDMIKTNSQMHIKFALKLAYQRIQWLFIPPSSPYMGRSWERMIWTVKKPIFAIIKDWILTDFQMLILFSEVKNIITILCWPTWVKIMKN